MYRVRLREVIGFVSLVFVAALPLGGCQTTGANLSLTPAQDAMLVCLVANVGSTISARYQADGSALCTLATGAAVIVGSK